MKKLDTIVGNLESALRAVHQAPRAWKLQWLDSVATRRAGKFPKSPASPSPLTRSSRRR